MAEDYEKLRGRQKELFEQVLKFRDLLGTNRLKRLMILYLYLKIPFFNHSIHDIVNFTESVSNRSVYQIIRPFRKKEWLLEKGTAGNEKVFRIPANKYAEVRSYFFDTLFTTVYGWRVTQQERSWIWEHWYMFADILARDPQELQNYREKNTGYIFKNNPQECEMQIQILKKESPSRTSK